MPSGARSRKFIFLGVKGHPGRGGRSRVVLAWGRTNADNVTGGRAAGAGVISHDPSVPALKTLAPERERAEIRIHPIGCPERRSSIQQAELESFQPRTPSSCGFGRRERPCSENEHGPRRWTSCPSTVGAGSFRPEHVGGPFHRFRRYTSRREEKPASLVPFS